METPLPPMNPEVARLRRQSAQRKYRKRLRRVRLLWTIAGALLFVLLIEVVVALLFSPRFWIYRITVNNLETLTEREVVQLITLPAHSNYHRTSMGELARRVRKEPRVDTVQVKHGRVGALVVDIRERQALCQLGYSAPPIYMDAQGYLFTRPVAPSPPVPVVEGLKLTGAGKRLGTQLKTPQARVVLECLREMQAQSQKTAQDIVRVTVSPKGWINLVMRQGTVILIGQPDDLSGKIWRLNKMIVQASNSGRSLEQLERIDVRYFNKDNGMGPTFRAKSGEEEVIEP